MNHLFSDYLVMNNVVVLNVKVLTQEGICGTVLTVEYLPSGEHKNYDHVLNSKSTILSTFQVNNSHITIYI